MKVKPYVRIQSEKTIQVTCGLQNQDVTNPDAHVADRLKISPMWPQCTVLIHQGAHVYPSEIAEWPTVKALANDKILTIGEYLDSADEKTEAKKTELTQNIDNMNAMLGIKENKKDIKLSDIAEEE